MITSKKAVCVLLVFSFLLLCACTSRASQPIPITPAQTQAKLAQSVFEMPLEQVPTMPESPKKTEMKESPAQMPSEPEEAEPENDPEAQPAEPTPEPNGLLVVLDPGHQTNPNFETEPLGPGSSEMKIKVSNGAVGAVTHLQEYELNLQISLLLRDELLTRGYEVVLTRESNDVDISNVERTQVANALNADAFVRIHANASESPYATGAMTICMTQNNPYNADLYTQSFALSEILLDAFVEATGAKKEYIWPTDTMTGINWSRVPVTILEMGYMTNPEEDQLLSSPDYQQKIVQGIANGLNLYFAEYPPEKEAE